MALAGSCLCFEGRRQECSLNSSESSSLFISRHSPASIIKPRIPQPDVIIQGIQFDSLALHLFDEGSIYTMIH
jgi:hypothetical protein